MHIFIYRFECITETQKFNDDRSFLESSENRPNDGQRNATTHTMARHT